MSEEIIQEEKKEEENQEQDFVSTVKQILASFPNSPSEDQIAQMKTEHGDIFASAVDEDEIYLFRPLSRREYLGFKHEQQDIERHAQQTGQMPTEDMGALFEERVAKACILWASKPNAIESKGGTISLIFEQVMLNSNFMNPAAAAQLVIKL